MSVGLNQKILVIWVKLAFITAILFLPQISEAEWFGDIYLGAHTTTANDLNVRFNDEVVQRYQDTDTGSVFGGRIGYWFEHLPWIGLAFDCGKGPFKKVDILAALNGDYWQVIDEGNHWHCEWDEVQGR